jgi:hypothetical protein
MDDPTDLKGLDDARTEKESKDRLKRNRELDDIRATMASKTGRRFMWRLISVAGVYRSTWSPVHAEMSRLEGARQFGVLLIDEIHAACPEQYEAMKREARNGR